ncbi:xanthine dehydrogenase molybdenum-binding subunit XdhA [Ruminococcaceae bacterium OttesenSCG-928-I18]|nr:xanthine dehydrogenase molybdenum-binding subunit XdhA [Ruminococcaceae bacterium OttesenSCG-928-I18]
MGIGQSLKRVDAYEKVTGRAKYTDDLAPAGALVAKVVRSTIANGRVLAFDLHKASLIPGVVRIFTCFDVPDIPFPTAGHPWSTDPAHQDVADRKLLNERVRIYGDDIAVVVADNALAAEQAAGLIGVEYETYPPCTDAEKAMQEGEHPLHEACPDNLLKHTVSQAGSFSFDALSKEKDLCVLQANYTTQVVQHCHIEPPVSYAYMDSGRVVVVTSTQIPHIVRRVVGQALGLPFGMVRVIKPYIGGGFGNKQEVLYEPLNAWLTTKLGGRAVKLELSREETFFGTRVRHAMAFSIKSAIRSDGRLVAREGWARSNQGGYASHGHSIVANAANAFRMLYQDEAGHHFDAYTVYTNLSSGGAMRGYGIPQIIFALESHMDDLALAVGADPIDLRMQNCMKEGYVDPGTGITCHSSGLLECLEKGRKATDWDSKRRAYQNQDGPLRKGIGMAIFCYKTGVYPISLETASARLLLNQDGSVDLQLGATEIGQGGDTVFTQMAAETIGIPESMVHIQSTQDTDTAPFDTGAYASRQTYVTGMAIKQTAEQFRQKLLRYAAGYYKKELENLDIQEGFLVEKDPQKRIGPLSEMAMEAFYSLENAQHITAETTHHCKENTFSFGVCFAEIEVDIPVGKIRIVNLLNLHDSGILINPQLAEAQVHGGMSMGLGYGLTEQLLFGEDARPLNGNLLDYKLPTSMDTPELQARFVETDDPTGPYGNKSLGEPPCIPVAPAVRNALLHATGVGINRLPLNPQNLVEHFLHAGLIEAKTVEGGRQDV